MLPLLYDVPVVNINVLLGLSRLRDKLFVGDLQVRKLFYEIALLLLVFDVSPFC